MKLFKKLYPIFMLFVVYYLLMEARNTIMAYQMFGDGNQNMMRFTYLMAGSDIFLSFVIVVATFWKRQAMIAAAIVPIFWLAYVTGYQGKFHFLNSHITVVPLLCGLSAWLYWRYFDKPLKQIKEP